jgi:hypothetical protein
VTRKLQVGVPRHCRDRALEEGMGIVEEARAARIFHGRKAAARDVTAIDRKHFQTGLAEIGLQHERVVTRAEDDAVPSHSMPSSR